MIPQFDRNQTASIGVFVYQETFIIRVLGDFPLTLGRASYLREDGYLNSCY